MCNCTKHTRSRGERYIGPRSVDPAVKKKGSGSSTSTAKPKRKVTISAKAATSRYEYDSSSDGDGPESVDVPEFTLFPAMGAMWGTVYTPSGERVGTGIVAAGNTVVVPGLSSTEVKKKGKSGGQNERRSFIGAPRPGWRALSPAPDEDTASPSFKKSDGVEESSRRRRWFIGDPTSLRKHV